MPEDANELNGNRLDLFKRVRDTEVGAEARTIGQLAAAHIGSREGARVMSRYMNKASQMTPEERRVLYDDTMSAIQARSNGEVNSSPRNYGVGSPNPALQFHKTV